MVSFQSKKIISKNVEGKILRLEAPLSLWDGLDSSTGTIIQGDHPNQGEIISDKIVVFANGLSGATAGAALTECVRTGNSPLAMILPEADAIVVTASVVAGELYNQEIPIFQLDYDKIIKIPNNINLSITDGLISWNKKQKICSI